MDDEPSMCQLLSKLCTNAGLENRVFHTPHEFLDHLDPDCTGCLVMDVLIPEIDGPQLLDRVRSRGIEMPVIFMSGYTDVRTICNVMRDGALDFLQKPFDTSEFLNDVRKALALDLENRQHKQERARCKASLASLTEPEMAVLDMLITGMANKVIAAELGISEKTVEYRRSRIMQKFDVDSFSMLIQKYLRSQEP